MIISFAWTTPALLAGAKTITRRDWTAEHAAKFRVGQLVDAWNHTPRVNSKRRGIAIARKVATIRITKTPYRQRMHDLTDSDWYREGFAWLWAFTGSDAGMVPAASRAMGIWQTWKSRPGLELYVVEFELVERVA